MRKYSRYAIYYAPEAGSELASFGASWLGWDADTGQSVAHPQSARLPVCELTATPRKYGFHGTLKPPFKLTQGYAVADLDAALDDFSNQQSAFDIAQVSLRSIDRFLAIMPEGECPELATLAQNCVRQLDAFRATPSQAELTRRRSASLTEAQEHNLMRWGYPYVLDQFRFHLTLTGRLTPEVAEPVLEHLQIELAPTLEKPLPVREICLFGEDRDGKFHIVKRYPLTA